ncbi:MAG TPA: response regulator [Myxococcaceae bacterium]|nr:response regulator [Myxococcaceae bacterium]
MNPLILVVDDHPDNLKLLSRYFHAKGYRVQSALSTGEADAIIERERPALVMVDLFMPGEDGLSWVSRVRQAGGDPIHFLAFTAHATSDAVDLAHAAGCEELITKPVPLQALLGIVQSRLGAAP